MVHQELVKFVQILVLLGPRAILVPDLRKHFRARLASSSFSFRLSNHGCCGGPALTRRLASTFGFVELNWFMLILFVHLVALLLFYILEIDSFILSAMIGFSLFSKVIVVFLITLI